MSSGSGGTRAAVVLGVQDTPAGWQALHEAADVARCEQATLHLVAAYDLQDSYEHRRDRVAGPVDLAYLTTPKGDAEALLREAAVRLAGTGVAVRGHVHHGSLRGGVRHVTRRLATAPAPAAPVSPPAREAAWRRLPSLRFRRRPPAAPAEAVALAVVLTEPAGAPHPSAPSPGG